MEPVTYLKLFTSHLLSWAWPQTTSDKCVNIRALQVNRNSHLAHWMLDCWWVDVASTLNKRSGETWNIWQQQLLFLIPQVTLYHSSQHQSLLAKQVDLTSKCLEVRFKNFCRCRKEPSRIFTIPQVLASNWLLTGTVFVGTL